MQTSPSPPFILALETSTSIFSAALYSSDGVISNLDIHKKNSHSEIITTAIQQLLKNNKLEIQNLSAVAISAGPGSYTGLRIGTSITKGLCFALKIPLIPINTLEAMAFGMQQFNFRKMLLCPMIDARRMEVYTTVINYKNEIITPVCPMIIEQSSFRDLLKDKEMIFFGDGAEKCMDLFKKNQNAFFIKNIYPSAINIAKMAYSNFKSNKFSDLNSFSPIYLKDYNLAAMNK